MGALKGRFQCLRGLRVKINSYADHRAAMPWITVTIILHNLIIDIEAAEGIQREWEDRNTGEEDRLDGDRSDGEDEDEDGGDDPAVRKRNQLIAELLCARGHEQH